MRESLQARAKRALTSAWRWDMKLVNLSICDSKRPLPLEVKMQRPLTGLVGSKAFAGTAPANSEELAAALIVEISCAIVWSQSMLL